jgi:DNA (cytosine-5)-methyltransferase 1
MHKQSYQRKVQHVVDSLINKPVNQLIFEEDLRDETKLSVLDICTGAGGQAIGLEAAGFVHEAAIEIDVAACQTLRLNRPSWRVIEGDIREVNGTNFRGIDMLAGGVPCPPFTIAGRQLGAEDERDLFPEAVRIIEEAKPSAVMLENVPGFASAKFAAYRSNLMLQLRRLGYEVEWKVLNASDYGVPQLRPRFVLVALLRPFFDNFHWPTPERVPPMVGQIIGDLMASRGWKGEAQWRCRANGIAPTLVGGSKKHGGPDLGPTRAREQWKILGVDGKGIADLPPGDDFPVDGLPRLTLRMTARLQAFPDTWVFAGSKTAAYRQVGNAFPPPVAQAVGRAIFSALIGRNNEDKQGEPELYRSFLLDL